MYAHHVHWLNEYASPVSPVAWSGTNPKGMRVLSDPFTHALTVAFDAGIAVSRAVSTLSPFSHVPSTVPGDADRGLRVSERDALPVDVSVVCSAGLTDAACARTPATVGVTAGMVFHATNPPAGMAASRSIATARCNGVVRCLLLCFAIQSFNPAT